MEDVYKTAKEDWGDCPKTHNLNLKVENKADDMELRESSVDSMNDYDVNLKQKLESLTEVK